jgi:cytochrome c-type biogenesis protein CcsB
VIHPVVFNVALIGYVCATGLALAYLIQREEIVYRLAAAATGAAWAAHTIALVIGGLERGQPPLGSLAEAVSVAVWVVVLVEMWLERRHGVKVLGAFVLPVALVLSLSAAGRPLELPGMSRALTSAWVWVHIGLALVGIAAFVLNFAGALMYLLQERQLKVKRPGAFYYRLPALETLDRLTYRALALGFPFLTIGLILGALWAGAAWGTVFTFDPLAMLSFLAWGIYAATLAGRTAAGWRGRRAAYFSIAGFAALALTLGAGLFLPGKHGS